ncbi:thiosulfate sulfurtransferase GlpE [Balneatrix alpica]|uniref:thiosulfate sulfurtransferase GlpE n=1 Tax=Balneatrix alpica TaxID=75684 RepID=UPI002738F56B|nr:thiosulfate sulfurtransferase GlpE [Balneatrix alpica]
MSYQCIEPAQAKTMLEQPLQIADIRDPASYAQGHLPGAVHLSNQNLEQFLQEADPDQPLLVVCYHGHSSQSAANFLAERGFDQVFSLNGGFEQWRGLYPELVSQD